MVELGEALKLLVHIRNKKIDLCSITIISRCCCFVCLAFWKLSTFNEINYKQII